jgi:hypothetical protein
LEIEELIVSIQLFIDDSVFDCKEARRVIEVNGNTIGECLNQILKKQPSLTKLIFDENGAMPTNILFKVNAYYLFSNYLATPIKDGDQIEISKFAGSG